jgi:phosphomannomutase
VLVGSDGTSATPELVAEACRALALAGCRALEAGSASGAALAAAARRHQAAAIWIGDATGEPHSLAIRFWDASGKPLSMPGRLEQLAAEGDRRPQRARRRGGCVERVAVDELYLPALADLYHGLRPLKFVLDTRCAPVERYWKRLSAATACRPLPPAEAAESRPEGAGFLDRRLARVAAGVLIHRAHFGVWIDGLGEGWRLVDERGGWVAPEAAMLAVAQLVIAERREPLIALAGIEAWAARRLAQSGAQIRWTADPREAFAGRWRRPARRWALTGRAACGTPGRRPRPMHF